MWSLNSIEFIGFTAKPSLKTSLNEFITDLKRISPHHSGLSGKIEKQNDIYKVLIALECSTFKLEQEASSKNLYEAIYFVFQSIFAQLLENENSKVQALPIKKLKKILKNDKKYVS